MLVREELAGDAEQVQCVQKAAFPTDAEGQLVEALRKGGNLTVSFVAVDAGTVLGHVAFSPVTIGTHSEPGLGLGPVAVRPGAQRRGVGSALIRAALARCKQMNVPFVVVLGDPAYYLRFGFRRAHAFGIGNEYQADAEFMALELVPGGLPRHGGVARYCKEFEIVA
jgi:putative acetyltransferase